MYVVEETGEIDGCLLCDLLVCYGVLRFIDFISLMFCLTCPQLFSEK